jgi:hypothetical protein
MSDRPAANGVLGTRNGRGDDSVTEARTTRRPAGPDLLARLQSALPLLIVYFALAALYAWQASRRPVPSIFTDELELTQLSRSISETGEAARRGDPYGLATLVAYVLAPVWWLGSTSAAYATAKLVLVLAMTATLFPAYALARMVVPRWYALAAAAGSTAVPALAYSPILVEEPLAYPVSTVALWLIARTLVRPSWGRAAAAAAAVVAAVLTRTQLAVLFAILALALVFLAWESPTGRRWRATWSAWDWVGGVTIVVGAVFALSAAMGHLSTSWREATGFYKDRVLDHATWATGALAIGVGILPLVAGVSALARPKREPRDPETRAFVLTSVAALMAFIWYAGIKGTYIQNTFSTVVVERNLIYLYPILFAGTALAIQRGVGRGWAIAAAAALTVYVVASTPLHLDQYPYYEAHGLAIATFANRELSWPEGLIEGALIVVCLAAAAVLVALRLLRRDSGAFRAVAATTTAVVLAWSLTAEVYAAEGERDLSVRIATNLSTPYDWVDDATGGASVVVLGQQINDPTGVQLTEFFNTSIRKMWSLDGTAPRPGPILTPDLQASDGTLTPSPDTDYALALNGIELRGPVVAEKGNDRLYRLDGKPLQLAAAVTGVSSDGWISDTDGDGVATAAYTRYDVSGDGPGFAIVKLSRVASCPRKRVPGKVTVKIGPVGIGADKQPAISRVTGVRRGLIPHCEATGFTLTPPSEPWRVEISITPTFVPQELDPAQFSDRRHLGAVAQKIGFEPLFAG